MANAKNKKKAPARGRRKSIVEKYKAKARGKKTSRVDEEKPKKAAPRKKYQPILSMTVGDESYGEGDIAWYVMEGSQFSKRPHSGEIKECHPTDSIAPCVTVLDHTFKHYRVIRAELIGWSKAEAKKKWEEFVKNHKDDPHFRG